MRAAPKAIANRLACFLAAGMLLAGCGGSNAKPSEMIEPSVPSSNAERDAWAVEAAEWNDVTMGGTGSVQGAVRAICTRIGATKNLDDPMKELAKTRGLDIREAVVLTKIAIYGYCPQHKQKWTSWDLNKGKILLP